MTEIEACEMAAGSARTAIEVCFSLSGPQQ